jgi:cytochrome c-type biogenesis protein CcmH/NrfG
MGAFHDTLGQAYSKAGQPAQAAAAFKQAIRREPRNLDYYLHLGETLIEQEDVEETRKVIVQIDRIVTDPSKLDDKTRQRIEAIRSKLEEG